MKSSTTDSARKTYAAHAAAPAANGKAQWVAPDDVEYHTLRKCMGASFAGTKAVKGEPLIDWTMSHLIGDDVQKEWYSRDDHRETLSFGLGFPIWEDLSNKHESLVVAVKASQPASSIGGDENDESKEEEKQTLKNQEQEEGYAGAVTITEFDPAKKKARANSWWAKFWNSLRMFQAFIKMASVSKVPALYSDQSHKDDMILYHKKLEDCVFNYMTDLHISNGPKQLHWYVHMVAVHPSYHGQGYGRMLMEEVNRLADEQNVILYLECGASNKGFYERMGYEVYGEPLSFQDPVDPKTRPSCDGYVMIRHPSRSSQ